jgi:hypothetical protein
MHHIAAFTATVASTTEQDLAALTDGILAIQNGHFLPQRDFQALFVGGAGAQLSRARLVTPSLRQITTPFTRPISAAAGWGMPQRVDTLEEGPLLLRQGEEVALFTTNAAATSGQVYGMLGLGLGPRIPVAGQQFTLRGTSSGTATANVWTQISVTWQDVLPQGDYAITGCEFVSSGQIMGRFILENQFYRPGAPGVQSVGSSALDMFRYGGLGMWGKFSNYAYPNVEVLCATADTSHEIYMDLVKL